MAACQGPELPFPVPQTQEPRHSSQEKAEAIILPTLSIAFGGGQRAEGERGAGGGSNAGGFQWQVPVLPRGSLLPGRSPPQKAAGIPIQESP